MSATRAAVAEYSPRVCIAGMGGIGGLIAAHLATRPLTLSVVARGETLHALKQRGLICSDEHTTTHHTVQADSRAPDEAQDLIILCGKYHHLPGLLKTVAHAITPRTKILPVVNGFPWWMTEQNTQKALLPVLDPHGVLGQLDRQQICGCVAYAFAQVKSPGHIQFSGKPHFSLGDTQTGSNCTRDVLKIISTGNELFHHSHDIRKDIWNKLCLNVSTNFLSVMYKASLHELAHTPDSARLIHLTLTEMHRLGQQALNLSDLPAPDALMSKIALGGKHPTSMLQDYLNNQPLELSAMGDAILALAQHFHVPMPTTETIITLTRRKAAMRQNYSANTTHKVN